MIFGTTGYERSSVLRDWFCGADRRGGRPRQVLLYSKIKILHNQNNTLLDGVMNHICALIKNDESYAH